ncbi:CBS-domain-containing protein, partial [Fragilariopsis cylindrus CCMP1102]
SDRKVSSLRPKKPLISSVGDSVLSVTQMLASKRGSASLIVNDEGGLAGIITDTDITRRLIAKHLDAASTSVSKVMTPNPTCVSMLDSAMDAMTTMVENHFRHLPVVDDKGGVVGLLDIAKCLNDAISKLEKKSKSTSGSVAQSEAHEALSQAMQSQGAQGAQAAALQALLAPLMNQAFGNQASPTLRSLLAGKPSTVVQLGTSVFEAGTKMAESRKAALVVEDGNLVGIFGFKDMMTRVVAKELPMDDTEISAVMTPNPESVSPDMTVLEALQTMHDNKFLTLPVCEENGNVVGLVNVMDVIYGCGGVEGWRSIFISKNAPMVSSSPPPLGNIPSTLEFQKGSNEEFDETTFNDTYRMETASFLSDGNVVVFKIVDPDGHTHRLHSEIKIVCLRKAFVDKLAGRLKATNISFKFFDEEGDAILISTDEDLAEAVTLARNAS